MEAFGGNHATVIHTFNPFDPSHGREVEQAAEGVSVQSWFDDHARLQKSPVVCLRNGKPIMREEWATTTFAHGDIVAFVALPLGDVNTFFENVTGIDVVQNIFDVADFIRDALNGDLFPTPDAADVPGRTYSFGGQGNTIRLNQPVPVIYGKPRVYPDLVRAPYQYFEDNVQHVSMLLSVGRGEYSIRERDVNLGGERLTQYDGADVQIVHPGDAITLSGFISNAVTSKDVSGIVVARKDFDESDPDVPEDEKFSGKFNASPFGVDINRIEIDILFKRGIYDIVRLSGNLQHQTVLFILQAQRIKPHSDTPFDSSSDWFDLTPVDIVNTLGGEIQIPDIANIPAGGTYSGQAYRNKNRGIKRFTHSYTLAVPGRYHVRIRRVSENPDGDKRSESEMTWQTLKGFTVVEPTYPGLTMLAVKLQVTNVLSGSQSRRVNCLAHRKLNTWAPATGWTTIAATSRSIVWAIADMLRDSEHGGNMSDECIDLQNLYDLDQVLAARGDYFDAVFSSRQPLWDSLKLVCRAGRCTPILQGGQFRLIRERLQTIPVAMFSPSNILQNSFSIEYALASEDEFDGVEVEYVDSGSQVPVRIRKTPGGITEPNNPREIRLFGVIDEDQVIRETLFFARAQAYRRTNLSFTTEMEGYIPAYGDLITVSHDVPRWGTSGTVWGLAGSAIAISEPVDFTPGATHRAIFRTRAGGAAGPFEIVEGENGDTAITLQGVWTFTHDPSGDFVTASKGSDSFVIWLGGNQERTHFAFGVGENWSQRCVVKSIKPQGEFKVGIKAVIEDDRVHAD